MNVCEEDKQIEVYTGAVHNIPDTYSVPLQDALRNLVMKIQQGLGYGHGFFGIFEIDKTKGERHE